MPLKTETLSLHVGPQHPSTHGVFRMVLTLDGETVVDLVPHFGYLHRGTEKLAEGRTYLQCVPLTDRLDYFAAMSNNLAYVLAVEKLANIEVPERAQYLRVIMAELSRLASHLGAVGFFLNECGAWFTPLLYTFRERERILDLFEMVCGARLTLNYLRPGGVSRDIPEEFIPALNNFLDVMPGYIDEYEQLLTENEVLLARSRGVGILPADLAINASASGPVLRASGVQWDLRRADPYSVYDRFEFEIPTGALGDCYDRFIVRLKEMRQSLRIIRQAVAGLPKGKYRTSSPMFLRPPTGEAYTHVEGPKGELGFYIVSDGSISPYRFKIRAPSFINLTALKEMIVGWKLPDCIVIFGSIDIVMGEVDR